MVGYQDLMREERARSARDRDKRAPTPRSISDRFAGEDDIATDSDALDGHSGRHLPKDRPSVTLLNGINAGQLITIAHEEVVFGRDQDGAGRPDPALAGCRARVFFADDHAYVQDLGSKFGTFVQGGRITSPVKLEDGDHIRLGDERILRYSLNDAAEEQAALELYEASVQDVTTGAYNRQYFDHQLEIERTFADRMGQPLALLLLDVDGFKPLNDAHGHVFGDMVLRVLAASVKRMLKPVDTLSRYGGDEFAVLSRGSSLRNGLILAERIRNSIEHLPFSSAGNELQVTVSIGVASALGPDETGAALVSAADQAMYRAKRRGRNAVEGSV